MESFFERDEYFEAPDHGIWCEKYRPKKFENFIGSQMIKDTFGVFFNKNEIPHILLYGSPGTGKTSLAKLIIKYIPCDYLFINASDENKIDDVRYKIQDFAVTMGINPLKIVVLDEADRLSLSAMSALRNLMETYSLHTRFLLTANYHERLLPAIISRCQCFEIKPPSKKECAVFLKNILDDENVKYELKDIAFIINSYFPDLRKIINFAQQSSYEGVLKINQDNVIETDYKMKLLELLKTPNKINIFTEIRQLIADASFSNYEELYMYLYENVDQYAPNKEALVIAQLAESAYQSSLVFEREITFCAALHKILTILNTK